MYQRDLRRTLLQDFANAAHIDRQTAASVLAMLNYMEQVKRVGKTGNAYIYDIEEHY